MVLGDGEDTDATMFAGGSLPQAQPGEGNIALYSGRNFGSADDIVHFVQWGSADQGRSNVAVDAGIWTAGEFVDAASLSNGGVIEYVGGMSAAGWATRLGPI